MECNEQSDQKSNNSGKCDAKCIKEEVIKPLDGGYAWVIVLGSFFINFICKFKLLCKNDIKIIQIEM